jgi:HD superfamily phosphohydrolase
MNVFDPLYGQFRIPSFLFDLLATPEVRRLSQVRLLNTLSPSLATLGELRRYSHTLGVLRLALANEFDGYSQAERMAFLASVLLHDTGTPPFGHLMEYHLRDLSGWHHEKVVSPLLWGGHHPANTAHQIFAGRAIQFGARLDKGMVSRDLVNAIIDSSHPLSQLLFGTLDLDNIDNVARMGWALGLSRDAGLALRIASSMSIDRAHGLVMPAAVIEDVEAWLDLRKAIYSLLVFDPPTVAAQAVLSEALAHALASGGLSEDDWSLSDEGLLDRLGRIPETKASIATEYLGRLPQMIFAIQLDSSLDGLAFDSRAAATAFVLECLKNDFAGYRPLAYIFVDNGAFSKRVSFLERHSRDVVALGTTSRSVVLYGFLRSHGVISPSRSEAAVGRLLKRLPAKQNLIRVVLTAPDLECNDSQRQLRLAD